MNIDKTRDLCEQLIQSIDDYNTDTMTTPVTVKQATAQLYIEITREKVDQDILEGLKVRGSQTQELRPA